jgi:hypothetical protein
MESCETITGLDILIPAKLDVLVLAQLTNHIKKTWLILGFDHEDPFRSRERASPVQGKGRSFVQADRYARHVSAIPAARSGLQEKAVHAESLDKSSTSLFRQPWQGGFEFDKIRCPGQA